MLKFKPVNVLLGSAVILLSSQAFAQNGMNGGPMMYGQPMMPNMGGNQYPAPPMNPEMMQRMMEQQQKKMQQMRAMQQAEMASQKKAMMAEQGKQKKACHHKGKAGEYKKHREAQMKMKQEHRQKMEQSLANIEKLMQEMLTILKSK